jgi:transcriptional regulator with XRE-family HTH domain
MTLMSRPLPAVAHKHPGAPESPGPRQIDSVGLGDFLRRRREALSPERLGFAPGGRRRTPGLRRDEVAALAYMSTNYYEKLERARGPQPSAPLLAALACALELTADERDHLYLLAGQAPPTLLSDSPGIDPELVSIMDALVPTTIALLMDNLGTLLRQNSVSVAVFGDLAEQIAPANNMVRRWFTDPQWRNSLVPLTDQEATTRSYVADLRASISARGQDESALRLIQDLSTASAEFAEFWNLHEVSLLRPSPRTLLHPEGNLLVKCAVVRARHAGQRLMTFQALPGTGTETLLNRLSNQRTQSVRAH